MTRWIERLLDKNVKLQEYEGLSGSWQTCAVGEKHKDFPAVVLNKYDSEAVFAPSDDVLCKLGVQFHEAVSRGWRNKALKLYDQIDARVRQLIRIRARSGR